MKALIVEDCEDLRTVLAILLKTEGFNVQQASNGKVALSILKKQKEGFQLLLTDFNMPLMNGLELIEEILMQKISVNKIIVLSGVMENKFHLEKLMTAHPHIKFVHKLTSTDQLLDSIQLTSKHSFNSASK